MLLLSFWIAFRAYSSAGPRGKAEVDPARTPTDNGSMPVLTGGEAVAAALCEIGVDHVFGIVSVHNLPIYDAILRAGEIRTIDVRHEQAGVHAADGYARASGRLGVAIASTGPGTTNAATGLLEAAIASSRVLLVTGQIETRYYGKGKGVLHEAERQRDMLASLTRRVESPRQSGEIAGAIVRLAREIQSGRPQPGAIEIPVDLQYATADAPVPEAAPPQRAEPDADAVERAAALIAESRRRVIWAGGGVVRGGASAELRRLAEALDAPVLTTVNGRGSLPEDHPLCLGALTADPRLTAILAEAEVIVAVGTRFQGGATRNFQLELPGKLIHIDADAGILGLNYKPGVAITADAGLALDALGAQLGNDPGDGEFLARARSARDEARAAMRALIGPDYAAIVDTIRETLPRGAPIVRDSTVPAYLWGDRLLPVYEPGTSLSPTTAAIGPGLPLAVGASLATGHKTVLIQGDGGFMLHIGEMATAAQYELPVVICVFNDAGYGVLRSIQSARFEGRQVGVDLATPDFAAVARGMGLLAESVKGVDEFRAAFARAVDAAGPVLLDVDMAALQPMRAYAGGARRRAS